MDTAATVPEGPRSDQPVRRSFTPAQKLDYLAAYEAACEHNKGGAYLRQEGLYSSQVTEWRKLRGAGVLAGKKPGERVGRPSAAWPRRGLKGARTEGGLDGLADGVQVNVDGSQGCVILDGACLASRSEAFDGLGVDAVTQQQTDSSQMRV